MILCRYNNTNGRDDSREKDCSKPDRPFYGAGTRIRVNLHCNKILAFNKSSSLENTTKGSTGAHLMQVDGQQFFHCVCPNTTSCLHGMHE